MLIRISLIAVLAGITQAFPQNLGNELSQTVTGQRNVCDRDPCKNGGECLMQPGTRSQYVCDCASGWNGRTCEIPNPVLTCGTAEITVVIDKRMIVGHNLDNNAQLIAFGESDEEHCLAILDGDNYKLSIKSPFGGTCGTTASRADSNESGNYLFSNSVLWRKVYPGNDGEAPIQRKIKLVDFNCNYEDEYLLQMVPLKPAESIIEQQNSKGLFKVDMTLWKNSDFENDLNAQYSSNPIVRIGQEVCVKLELDSKMDMEHLVLTASDCWASGVDHPVEDQRHYIIKQKCNTEDDYTTTILQNGISDTVKFCFKIYKWESQMDNIYVQCRMAVCDDSVQISGSSQCVCPPAAYRQNSWYYPNYYGAQMDKLADEFADYSNDDFSYEYFYTYGDNYATGVPSADGSYPDTYEAGLYGDNYSNYEKSLEDTGSNYNTFYYDYIGPEEEFEAGRKRKRRAVPLESEENKTEDSSEDSLFEEEVDKSKTLPKATGDPFKKSANHPNGLKPTKKKRFEILNAFKKDDKTGKAILPEALIPDPASDIIPVGYGPIQIKEKADPQMNNQALSDVQVTEIIDDGEWFESAQGANNVILIAVGGSLIFALIVLGVVVGIYVQFKNQADQKNSKTINDQQQVKAFYQGVMKGSKGDNNPTFVRTEGQ